MKISRDISGKKLIKFLEKFGYEITRQTGSHIRVTTEENGKHQVTVPNHKDLKIGTIDSIIKDIAEHFKIEKSEVIQKLFSNE